MAAKYLDENGLLYLWNLLKGKFGEKVDIVEGKNLSTNDFTTEEKDKLSGIEDGANVSNVQGFKLNGDTISPDGNKVVNISVITENEVDTKISTAIGSITEFSFEIATGDGSGKPDIDIPVASKIYLIPKEGSTSDVYDEWIWVSGTWEHFGQTDIDLSAYAKTADFIAITNTEIDTILAS